MNSFHGTRPTPDVPFTFYTPFSPWNPKNKAHNTKTVIVQLQDYLSTEAPFAVMLHSYCNNKVKPYICVGYNRDSDEYHMVTRKKKYIQICKVRGSTLLAARSLECLFVHMFGREIMWRNEMRKNKKKFDAFVLLQKEMFP